MCTSNLHTPNITMQSSCHPCWSGNITESEKTECYDTDPRFYYIISLILTHYLIVSNWYVTPYNLSSIRPSSIEFILHSRAYPSSLGAQGGGHHGQDAKPLQDTITLPHNGDNLNVNQPTTHGFELRKDPEYPEKTSNACKLHPHRTRGGNWTLNARAVRQTC